MEDLSQENINITIPVKINYSAIEIFLQEKAVGETIQVEKADGDVTKYAEILDVSLQSSEKDLYDLSVEVKFRTLTSFLGNRVASVLIDVALDYDNINQQITVRDYKLKGNGKNWFINQSLEAVANTLVKEKLRNKMKYDFSPHLEKQITALNLKLQNNFSPAEGIMVAGNFSDIRIIQIVPGNSQLSVLVEIKGIAFVEVKEINLQ